MVGFLGCSSLVLGVFLISQTRVVRTRARSGFRSPHLNLTRHLPEILLGLAIVNLLLMILSSYYGSRLTELLSFQVIDGWCDTSLEGVGQHCFGDFGLPLRRGGQQLEYDGTGYNYGASNPPVIAILFRGLSLFSYNVGLFLYLSGMILALLISWHLLWRNKFFSLMFALISSGSLVALDRGNHVPLVAVGLSLYLNIFQTNLDQYSKWSQSKRMSGYLLLGLIASLKFWAPMFLILPLFAKRFRFFCASLFSFVGLNLTALAILNTRVQDFLQSSTRMILDSNYASAVSRYSISLQSFFGRMRCSLSSNCEPSLNHDYRVGFVWTILFLTIPLIFIIWTSLKVRHSISSDFRPFALILSSLILLPEAATYNLVLIPALILSMPGMANGIQNAKSVGSRYADQRRNVMITSCLLCSVPFAIWWVPEMSPAGSTNLGRIFGYFRAPSIVVPVVFLTTTILIGLLISREYFFKRSSKSAQGLPSNRRPFIW